MSNPIKNTLIFLSSISQLNTLLNQYQNKEAMYIVSLHLDVSAQLSHLNYDFYEISDFVSEAETQQTLDDAYKLSNNWFSSFESQSFFYGLSPLRMDRVSLFDFFGDSLMARLILRNILTQLPHIQRLLLFQNTRMPYINFDGSFDTRTAVWLYMAERQSIVVDNLHQSRPTPTSKSIGQRLLTLFSMPTKIITNPLLRYLLKGVFHRFRTVPPILMVMGSNETHRYAYIASRLRDYYKGRLILGALSAWRVGTIHIPKYEITYFPFGVFPGFGLIHARKHIHKVYKLWKRAQQDYDGTFPEILANNHLDFQFKAYFLNRLTKVLDQLVQSRLILRLLRPALVMTTSISHTFQSTLVEAARQLNIPSLVLPHSAIPEGLYLHTDADHVLVWTKDFLKDWAFLGIPRERIHVIGLPKSIIADGYEQHQRIFQAEKNYQTILVVLAGTWNCLQPKLNWKVHLNTLSHLVNIPPHLRRKVRLILKTHPVHDFYTVYDYLLNNNPSATSIEVIVKADITDLVKQADLVVMANFPTSAYMLALLEEKPFLFVRATTLLDIDFALTHEAGQFIVRNNDELWRTIESTLYSSVFRQQIINGNRALYRELVDDSEDVIGNLQRIIDKFL